ncbi:LysR family transcriptional regulator [bacterium]|nr:LysR family transcriptional regulator [bacterium]
MLEKISSLEAIRYFEASARLLSFTKAGEELHISQSAISQKIISLENSLGFKLFHRRPRKLTLTPDGEKLFNASREALGILTNTLRSINTRTLEGSLSVVAAPSIVSKWLLPKLPRFYLKHPEIELAIKVNIELANPASWLPDFKSYNTDIAICFGKLDLEELSFIYLFDDYLFPVCSPGFLKENPISAPQDLNKVPILKDSNPKDFFTCNWNEWFQKLGIKDVDISRGYSFNRLDLLIQSAINGQGVALGRHSLVADDIEEGRLVKLFNEVPSGQFHLVTLSKLAENLRIKAFIDWMKGEINA